MIKKLLAILNLFDQARAQSLKMFLPDTSKLSQHATQLCHVLHKAGHIAWFAGGCVRDALLGQVPKDIDIATDATPEEVQALFPKTQAVGAHFGVILVHYEGEHFEVATFRSDGSYSDARRPDSIKFTSPEEDAKRRDFTLNALFFDPLSETLHDFIGGQADLESKTLRTVGEPKQRFQEDALRLLRAVRFAARFDLDIEPRTRQGLRQNAPLIERITPERILAELNQIWAHPSRLRGFDLLDESGLLALLLPEIEATRGVEQPPQWHPEGDVFVHTRLVLSHLPEDAPLNLVWAALLHDIGKTDSASWDETQQRWRFNGHAALGAQLSEQILQRLRAPKLLIEEVSGMVVRHMSFIDVKQMRKATLRRMMARATFEQEMQLHLADCLGSNGFTDHYEFLRQKAAEFAQEPLIPPPLLTGFEVMRLTGLKPSRKLGQLLKQLQEEQLEGRLNNAEEAKTWLQERPKN